MGGRGEGSSCCVGRGGAHPAHSIGVPCHEEVGVLGPHALHAHLSFVLAVDQLVKLVAALGVLDLRYAGVCVCVCECVCGRMCMCVCVCVCTALVTCLLVRDLATVFGIAGGCFIATSLMSSMNISLSSCSEVLRIELRRIVSPTWLKHSSWIVWLPSFTLKSSLYLAFFPRLSSAMTYVLSLAQSVRSGPGGSSALFIGSCRFMPEHSRPAPRSKKSTIWTTMLLTSSVRSAFSRSASRSVCSASAMTKRRARRDKQHPA